MRGARPETVLFGVLLAAWLTGQVPIEEWVGAAAAWSRGSLGADALHELLALVRGR